MVNVTSVYKLITLDINGEKKTLMINPKEAWGVFESVFEDKKLTVNEGNHIEFVNSNGEKKTGYLDKIGGKGSKTKLTIIPDGIDCQETWPVSSIIEGTLKVLDNDDAVEVVEADKDEEENENNEE
jgi:hypothetical protein